MHKGNFDPNATGNTGNNIFGLPFSVAESEIVIIPVPWEVTVSNFGGTAKGPSNVLENSYQIDFFDPVNPEGWKKGFAMEPIDLQWVKRNNDIREVSQSYIKSLDDGQDPGTNASLAAMQQQINDACEALCQSIESKALKYLHINQTPIILGGDHSVPLGLIRALAKKMPGFGILQIDAHADLRNQYQGLWHSHASIMHNALAIKGVEKLVQVGIRELCPEEQNYIANNPDKITTHYDHAVRQRIFEGESWAALCREIVSDLPQCVYLSFDVDGLEPALCPGTGTPLPGGLSYQEAMYLLKTVVESGRSIIGADLVETGQGSIDGIVSSRLLFRIAGLVQFSRKQTSGINNP